MRNLRYPRRKPLSKEELTALQRERDERIAVTSEFPWIWLVVAVIAAAVAMAVTGGGFISLLVALLTVIILLARRFKPHPPIK